MNYFLLFYTIGDKIVIGKLFKESLTEYIFLSNILSMPLLFVMYFYVSKYKAEFVNNLISLKNVLISKKFNYLLISTFFLFLLLSYFTKT